MSKETDSKKLSIEIVKFFYGACFYRQIMACKLNYNQLESWWWGLGRLMIVIDIILALNALTPSGLCGGRKNILIGY